MTPRNATPVQAEQAVRDYRAAHTITPVPDPEGAHVSVCAWDLIPVYRVKNGWRHNMAEVRVLIERAPIPKPGDYE
jgi:hypothetical protein